MAGPPDGKTTIRSLAKPAGKVTGVVLLGSKEQLDWQQTDEGLIVNLPTRKPCQFAYGLKVTGEHLIAAPLPEVIQSASIRFAPDGSLRLGAGSAETHGGVRAETRSGPPNLGYWNNSADWVAWKVTFPKPAAYQLTAETASPYEGIEFTVEAAGQQLTAKAPMTGSHDDYATATLGKLQVKQAGECIIKVAPPRCEGLEAD